MLEFQLPLSTKSTNVKSDADFLRSSHNDRLHEVVIKLQNLITKLNLSILLCVGRKERNWYQGGIAWKKCARVALSHVYKTHYDV